MKAEARESHSEREARESERAGPSVALSFGHELIAAQRVNEGMPCLPFSYGVVIVRISDTFAKFGEGLVFFHDQIRSSRSSMAQSAISC